MSGRRLQSIAIIWLVLSFLTPNSAASFQDCYAICFAVCALTPGISFSDCAIKCLQACISPPFPMDFNDHRNNRHFCKLGCATSLCTKFSSKRNPAEKKVGRCVDSCSQTCSKD